MWKMTATECRVVEGWGSMSISLASVAVEESITVILTVLVLCRRRRRRRRQPHAIMYSQFAFSMPHCV